MEDKTIHDGPGGCGRALGDLLHDLDHVHGGIRRRYRMSATIQQMPPRPRRAKTMCVGGSVALTLMELHTEIIRNLSE
jgi:hypothetical protein